MSKQQSKSDTIRLFHRVIDKGYKALDKAVAPKKPNQGRSFFDVFMDEVTLAPKKRRW